MRLAVGVMRLAVAVLVIGVVPQAAAQDEIVARIGDIEVTFAEVEESWNQTDASSRLRMLQQLYETRWRALDNVIGEHLVDREARERGITRAALLSVELPSRTSPVTDEEVVLVYERNQDSFGGRTLEQMRAQIRVILEQQRPTQALHEFMGELRLAADDVVVLLDPPRQEVAVLAEDPSRGPKDAPVVIVEFSDFECPFCKRATATLDALLERYGDRVRFVFKDFPLPSHSTASKAAEAGNCANEQNRFWEFHDKLFATQGALDVSSLKAYAVELGLDAAAFASCLDGGQYAAAVSRDLQIGRDSGASSTPTFFINGRPVLGALPLEVFDRIVRRSGPGLALLAVERAAPARHPSVSGVAHWWRPRKESVMISFSATLVLALTTQIAAATTGQIQKWYEAGQHEQVVQAAVQDQDPLLVYLAGSSLEKLERLEEARQMYGQLVGRGETDPWALVGRAAAELVTGSGTPSADALTRAAQSVDRAIDVAPGLAAAHFQRGLIEGHKRDYASAAAAFEQAMRLDSAFAYAHYYAGLSYSRIDRPDQMAIHFERFLSLAPEAPEAGQVQSLMRSVRGRR